MAIEISSLTQVIALLSLTEEVGVMFPNPRAGQLREPDTMKCKMAKVAFKALYLPELDILWIERLASGESVSQLPGRRWLENSDRKRFVKTPDYEKTTAFVATLPEATLAAVDAYRAWLAKTETMVNESVEAMVAECGPFEGLSPDAPKAPFFWPPKS